MQHDSPNDPTPELSELEDALPSVPTPQDQMPAPMRAMAEALRANAEALQRVDATQRKLVDRIERGDRSQQVVASTRALNDTFRGLSEIQRGLLDAVLKIRGGSGNWMGFLFVSLAVAIFAAVMGFLFAERQLGSDSVSNERFAAAQRETERVAAERDGFEAKLRDASGRERDLRRELAAATTAREAAAGKADSEREAAAAKIKELERDLERKKASLEEFVRVKQQADTAGALQVRNATLERENRTLQQEVERLRRQEANALGFYADRLKELAEEGNAAALIELAKKNGTIKKDPRDPPPEPGGPEILKGGRKRLIREQLNRLFPDADETFRVDNLNALEPDGTFQGVRLTRYEGSLVVGTLVCKTMTLTALDNDVVEVKLRDGHMANTRRPGERIPIGEDGHSIFLRNVGLKAWLRTTGRRVVVDEKGRLTWKTTPS